MPGSYHLAPMSSGMKGCQFLLKCQPWFTKGFHEHVCHPGLRGIARILTVKIKPPGTQAQFE